MIQRDGMKSDEATLMPDAMEGRRGEEKADGVNEKSNKAGLVFLGTHEYSYKETSCAPRTKALQSQKP